MQAIGEFHEHHTDIADHGEQQLAVTFGLRDLAGFENVCDLGSAIDDVCYFRAKLFAYFLDLIRSIFHDIVQQSGNDGNIIERNFLRDDHRDFERMNKVRLT